MAIQLDIKVIAEGVETNAEFLTCKDIGCHLVQGYLIQRPTKETSEILNSYENITDIIKNDKRYKSNNKLEPYLNKQEALNFKTPMKSVIEHFKENKNISVVPIVNSMNEPVGILRETQIKEFLYSPYGMSLLLNEDTNNSKLKKLIKHCGSTDISSNMSSIIELFSNNPESVGIIITKNSKYYGFLSSRDIISVMNEENLLYAREQNPLTKLPGNSMIEKYISDASTSNSTYLLCYFDLDNFKAFNDLYGFRNGDRVIQLFADTLRKNFSNEFFNAHIGGDDFFSAIKNSDNKKIYIEKIAYIITKFTDDVRDFYSQEDKQNGYIISIDRDKNKKKFPLLTVSASILLINKKTKDRCAKNIHDILSKQKKVAKHSPTHMSISTLI